MPNVHLTMKSANKKTGPIPVSTTSAETCPEACPLLAGGCYAKSGPLALHWSKVTSGERGMPWSEFCNTVSDLPPGQLWRHNQAGDLPGRDGTIDRKALSALTNANKGRRGFTYTHHDMAKASNRLAVARANLRGFTVNLSGNNLAHADKLADLDCGPVVTIVPEDFPRVGKTPKGRKVIVCPNQTRDVSCADCKLCQSAARPIIAFRVHGTSKRKASVIATN